MNVNETMFPSGEKNPSPARSLFAGLVMMDGLITTVWGKGFMRWLFKRLPDPLHKIPLFFDRWPSWLLRMGAVLQASAGAWLLLHEFSGRK